MLYFKILSTICLHITQYSPLFNLEQVEFSCNFGFIAAGVKCRVVVKCLLLLHHNVVTVFDLTTAHIHTSAQTISFEDFTAMYFSQLHMLLVLICITKTLLFKYIENFRTKKGKFSDKKNSNSFHISAQNIDCGYSLEPPR